MAPFETQMVPFSEDAVAEAARLIVAGEPVAVPTETVYGLAADARNAQAIGRIYEAKGRPSFNPLIVHVPDTDTALAIAEISPALHELAMRYWPGPLTIVGPLRSDAGIASLATAGLSTVAVRVPRHRAMRALLEASGRPLAAPSANASGTISPTRAEHVLKSLDGRIPLIVDDGPTPGGIESTIVTERDGQIAVLRAGPIELEGAVSASGGSIQAPGQLASHYAPSKPLRLNASEAAPDEFWIGLGALPGDQNLSTAGDLTEAAARLFDLLHTADESDKPRIAVAPVPETGIGRAINDRLKRAAVSRPRRPLP